MPGEENLSELNEEYTKTFPLTIPLHAMLQIYDQMVALLA